MRGGPGRPRRGARRPTPPAWRSPNASPPPTPPMPSGSATSPSAANRLGDVRGGAGRSRRGAQAYTAGQGHRANAWPPPTPPTPSGSATSPSAGTSSATCAWPRATSPGRSQAYTAGKAIAERLAAADPANAEWQRDLSVSCNKLGDVREAQGDLAGALAAYHRSARPSPSAWPPPTPPTPSGSATSPSATIGSATCRRPRATCRGARRPTPKARPSRERLAAADPANAGWQRDLSVSCEQARRRARGPGRPAGRAPGLHRRQGHRRTPRRRRSRQRRVAARPLGQPEQDRRRARGAGRPRRALDAYTAGKAIRERLAAADPANAEWQRDLSVSWERLASVQETQANGFAALAVLAPGPVDQRAAGEGFPRQRRHADHAGRPSRRDCPPPRPTPIPPPGPRPPVCSTVPSPSCAPWPRRAVSTRDRQGWIAWIESERAKLGQPPPHADGLTDPKRSTTLATPQPARPRSARAPGSARPWSTLPTIR